MSTWTISGPAPRFLTGLAQTHGYYVEADGERGNVAFEPWSLEQGNPFDVPCLRLQFRQIEARMVLERFTIPKDGEERAADLEAPPDAPQGRRDSMAG